MGKSIKYFYVYNINQLFGWFTWLNAFVIYCVSLLVNIFVTGFT